MALIWGLGSRFTRLDWSQTRVANTGTWLAKTYERLNLALTKHFKRISFQWKKICIYTSELKVFIREQIPNKSVCWWGGCIFSSLWDLLFFKIKDCVFIWGNITCFQDLKFYYHKVWRRKKEVIGKIKRPMFLFCFFRKKSHVVSR